MILPARKNNSSCLFFKQALSAVFFCTAESDIYLHKDTVTVNLAKPHWLPEGHLLCVGSTHDGMSIASKTLFTLSLISGVSSSAEVVFKVIHSKQVGSVTVK